MSSVNQSDVQVTSSVDEDSFVMKIAIITGCFIGAILLFLLIVLIILRRRRKKRLSVDMFLEDAGDEITTSKSAPISRKNSPKLEKRKSCPDAYGALNDSIARSMTMDSLNSYTMPQERVQPLASEDKSLSTSSLEYQNKFLGSLNQDLYSAETDGVATDLYLPPSSQGRLWFSVTYDQTVEQLNVTLIKVKELTGRSTEDHTRDPFVKVVLQPDESSCRTSKVRKKTLSPVYNETFIFRLTPLELTTRSLRFSVYDVDKRRVRHSLGHVVVPLQDIDVTKNESLWRDLEVNVPHGPTAGELNIGLNYLPHMENMKVIILRARNLKSAGYDPELGLIVKIDFYNGMKLVRSKQTLLQRAGEDTNFNESFTFSTAGKNIDNCNYVISVMLVSRAGNKTQLELGQIALGSFMFAQGAGLQHWQDMLNQTRNVVSKWHQISSSFRLFQT